MSELAGEKSHITGEHADEKLTHAESTLAADLTHHLDPEGGYDDPNEVSYNHIRLS